MAGRIFSKWYIAAFTILAILAYHSVLSSAFSQLVRQELGNPDIVYDHRMKVETVQKGGLNFPTSMAFLGPNDILVLEKNEGTVKRILNGTILPEPVLKVSVANRNEMGMLGIAILNNSTGSQLGIKKQTTYVFIYFSAEGKNNNRLYRYEFLDNKLVNPKLILEVPWDAFHNGGKIILGPDETMYLAAGQAGHTNATNSGNTTNFDKTAGILRFDLNGKPMKNAPLENKYPNNLYYAYGIRNSYGLALDPITGKLWDTENGPSFGDEINLVEPGFNSGWKIVAGIWYVGENESKGNFAGESPNGLNDFNGKGKYSGPEFFWNYSVGFTGIVFIPGDKLGKNYEGDMFVGDFHNGFIYHFDLNRDRTKFLFKKSLNENANYTDIIENITFAKGFGGITDLEVGPDGYLYVLATFIGGSDCNAPNIQCVAYNGTNSGSIFRIRPMN